MFRLIITEIKIIPKVLQTFYLWIHSLFRSAATEKVGLVTDDQYKRLLDWAFQLKLFSNGYYGEPCETASFIVESTESDISSGSKEDYSQKRYRVLKDFVQPIVEKFGK